VPVTQARSPEFKPQSHIKRSKEKKNGKNSKENKRETGDKS
jgi:hypothetical protein